MLLHGFLGSSRNLGALARRWASADSTVRLLQVDLPGHGKSPPLTTGTNLMEVAEDMLTFLDTLGVTDPIAAVGHSLGGRLALALRRLAPNRLRSITLLDITPGPITDNPAGAIARDLLWLPDQSENRDAMADPLRQRGHSASLVDWLLMNLVRTEAGYRWRIDRRALYELHLRSSSFDFWAEVEQAPQETLLVRGGDSTYVSASDVERFLQLGARVETVPDAGHFLHVDRPKEVAELIIQDALHTES